MAGSTKRVSPAVLQPLKEALTLAYWFKPDLRAFLNNTLGDRHLVAQFDWQGDYKRTIVAQLVDSLASQQHKYFNELLSLILDTAAITDPSWLKRVEDGEKKYADAVAALKTLREQVEPYRRIRSEEEEATRRREAERADAETRRAMTEKLEELRTLLYEIVKQEPQARGYSLEKLLNQLFALFDIDAKAPFKVYGEQIDGAFTFDGTEFLLEAKWQNLKCEPKDLDIFASKVSRKLDNTLGLFLSMNGFQQSAIDLHSQGRPLMILMDGADLSAIIDNRIKLSELLTRKRQHAARTGEIYLGAYNILG
ncbi:hypothetical protein [Kutzneria sp. NPDC051319]|uniref:hypothetical protein n=1 Tax=Kutzneria sp. NPDC051319 TaxID=3155047 RepID=UPI0034251E3D